jgi:hypothetical protein
MDEVLKLLKSNFSSFEINEKSRYLGWSENVNSELVKRTQLAIQSVFNEQPKIVAYHA